MPNSARSIVCDHLTQVIPTFPDLPLAGPDLSRLDAREAALARAIDGAVRRRWLTLEALLRVRLNRDVHTIEPSVRAALLAGAAQLLLLDRLPDHAVLHETVEWTKRSVRPAAGNFVNAVLRAVIRLRDEATRRPLDRSGGGGPSGADELGRNELPLEDGAVLCLREDVFAIEPGARLAAQTSHLPGLVMRWLAAYGPVQARTACLHGVALAPTIVRPVGEGAPSVLEPHDDLGAAVYTGAPGDLAPLLATMASAWVQDPASAAAVDGFAALLAATPGAAGAPGAPPTVIVDLCAGKGTKTRQLAHAFPSARVLASDPDARRFATLGDVFRRSDAPASPGGSGAVEVVADPSLDRRAHDMGGAELVLLDVPCSNTGVLARRLEARYRFTIARLRELSELQRTIARRGVSLLRPGGRLLYTTCSLEPEENQAQWAWIGGELGLRRIAAEAMLPTGLPGEPAARWRDGGAWAAFERS